LDQNTLENFNRLNSDPDRQLGPMANWKSNLIDAYRFTTAPLRAWQKSMLMRAGQLPIYILFYHRVSDVHPNPWTIGCSDFQAHLDWLAKNFQLVSLKTAQLAIASGYNRTPMVAITFDDGYAENLEFAIPLMLERRIPLTYFVTLGNILQQRPFEHDIVFGQPLPVNSIESIRAMSNAGIEIGAHTRNHIDLGDVSDPEILFDEVIASGRELAFQISKPVRYFAFPFGQRNNLNRTAFRLLKDEGYLGACTTLGAANSIGSDSFQLSRLHGDPSLARIKNWLNFDPRLTTVDRFDYEDPYPTGNSHPEFDIHCSSESQQCPNRETVSGH
jgi:peptidoglycan/xylan/chitin deacetylase (PgdA/CDA1 family)